MRSILEKDICKRDICGDICREDVYEGDICEGDIYERNVCGKEIYGREICKKDGNAKR